MARLIDADTVRVLGAGSVRLAGLDAPEIGQPATDARGRRFDAGRAVAKALAHHIAERKREGLRIRVRGEGRDKYRRILGAIVLEHPDGRTEDAGGWLVRNGLAVAEYGDQYAADERRARAERAGLWAGEFERPRDYRRRARSGGKAGRRSRTRPRRRRGGIFRMLARLMRW